jgi:hypothetical protein
MNKKQETTKKEAKKTAVDLTDKNTAIYWFLAVHNPSKKEECKAHWGWQ